MTTTPEQLAAETKALLERLSDESDLCRNDGADDIARLLDDAHAGIRTLSTQVEQLTREKAAWFEQHGRDSAELRRLCQARDDETKARKAAQEALYAERERCTAEVKAEQLKHSATLAELAALREQGQWLPIETAPKDGTEVLLVFSNSEYILGKVYGRVRAACWTGYGSSANWSIPYFKDDSPTHWHPLPAPPTGEV